MNEIQISFLLSDILEREKLYKMLERPKEIPLFYKLLSLTQRKSNRLQIISLYISWIKSLMESIENKNVEKWLEENKTYFLNKVNKKFLKEIKKRKIDIGKLEKDYLEVSKLIKRKEEIYPLNIYLSKTLEILSKFIEIDFKLMNSLSEEKYIKLLRESFEFFKEKSIVLNTLPLTVYLLIEKISKRQWLYLTFFYQKFLSLVTSLNVSLIEIDEKEFEKIPELLAR